MSSYCRETERSYKERMKRKNMMTEDQNPQVIKLNNAYNLSKSSIVISIICLFLSVIFPACNSYFTEVEETEVETENTIVLNTESEDEDTDETMKWYNVDIEDGVYRIKVKPCPFCGSYDLRIFAFGLAGAQCEIKCNDCAAKTDLFTCCTLERVVEEAVYCWNNRIKINGIYKNES